MWGRDMGSYGAGVRRGAKSLLTVPPRPSIKGRACFCSRVCAMPCDRNPVVLLDKIAHEVMQCCPLSGGEIAIRQTGLVDPANEANANAVAVVALCVCAFLLVRPAIFNRPIATDDVMVANVHKATVIDMPITNFRSPNILSWLGC